MGSTTETRAVMQVWTEESRSARSKRKLRRRAALLTFAVYLLSWGGIALGDSPPERKPQSYGQFDFATCVRYALVHSDAFLRNSIQVQIASSDLKDAHSELLPTVTIATVYYFTRTTSVGGGHGPFSVDLEMKNWNPYAALLKIRSQEVLVDIAKTTHYEKINAGISDIAKAFYRIHTIEKQIGAQKQMLALLSKRLDYANARVSQEAQDRIQARIYTNDLRQGQFDLKCMQQQLESTTANLKLLMGYHPDYHLPLDTRDAVNQILNGFDGHQITFGDVQAQNLGLKVMAKREQLQSNVIASSYVALLPQPALVFQGLSNVPNYASGVNVGLGFGHTLWDGFRHVRDVKTQKMKYRQLQIDRNQQSRQLYNQYRQLMSNLGLQSDKETIFRERTKLSELDEEKAFTNYKAGGVTYADYVQARMSTVTSSVKLIEVLGERVAAIIDLATLAGGLEKYNARLQH